MRKSNPQFCCCRSEENLRRRGRSKLGSAMSIGQEQRFLLSGILASPQMMCKMFINNRTSLNPLSL